MLTKDEAYGATCTHGHTMSCCNCLDRHATHSMCIYTHTHSKRLCQGQSCAHIAKATALQYQSADGQCLWEGPHFKCHFHMCTWGRVCSCVYQPVTHPTPPPVYLVISVCPAGSVSLIASATKASRDPWENIHTILGSQFTWEINAWDNRQQINYRHMGHTHTNTLRISRCVRKEQRKRTAVSDRNREKA